jgi:hypothetical protein
LKGAEQKRQNILASGKDGRREEVRSNKRERDGERPYSSPGVEMNEPEQTL